MKMKKTIVLGAICSALVLSLSNCSKDDVGSNLYDASLEQKSPNNLWTDNGNPKFSEYPTFYQITNTTQFHFAGKLTGLGNASNATLTIDAVVMVDPSCYNPGNGMLVKGVSKPVTKSVTKTYQLTNGKFDFSQDTDPVTVEDLGGGICPNDQWRTQIDAVKLMSYTIKINGVDFYSQTVN